MEETDPHPPTLTKQQMQNSSCPAQSQSIWCHQKTKKGLSCLTERQQKMSLESNGLRMLVRCIPSSLFVVPRGQLCWWKDEWLSLTTGTPTAQRIVFAVGVWEQVRLRMLYNFSGSNVKVGTTETNVLTERRHCDIEDNTNYSQKWCYQIEGTFPLCLSVIPRNSWGGWWVTITGAYHNQKLLPPVRSLSMDPILAQG